MTTHDRDKIIAAAKEADPGINEQTVDFLDEDGIEKLERFYAIAFEDGRKVEREECAKVCEAEAIDRHNIPAAIVARRCSEAIRARSTK